MRLHLTPHTTSKGTIAPTSPPHPHERKGTTPGACQVWFEFLSAAGKKRKEDNILNVPMPPCPGSSRPRQSDNQNLPWGWPRSTETTQDGEVEGRMTGRGGRGKEKREGRGKKRKEEPNAEEHKFGKENFMVLQLTAGILGSVSHGHTIL